MVISLALCNVMGVQKLPRLIQRAPREFPYIEVEHLSQTGHSFSLLNELSTVLAAALRRLILFLRFRDVVTKKFEATAICYEFLFVSYL